MSVGSTPSLNFIGDTVGDTGPHSMSEMRGIRFASGNSPTTGPISLSDFRNQVLNRDPVEQAKIKSSDIQYLDSFGISVSLSGDGLYAIVGAVNESTGEPQAGAAYIFKRTNASWSQQAKIQASTRQAQAYFGRSVSISDDGLYAISAADHEDIKGAAYIFNRTNSLWSQQAKIQSSDIQNYDRFGYSVAISGDGLYAIVGAMQESPNARGAAYIFKRTDSAWAEQAKITASDKQDYDTFGWAVSISRDGSYAIVGARGEDTGQTNAGAAYIFNRTNSTWAQQAKIQASDKQRNDYFGSSVSISGDGSYAIVGAPLADMTNEFDSGAAYIFKRSTNSSWAEQAKIEASDKQGGSSFGYSVSISGDGSHAIAGARGEDTGGSGSGAAYIFKRTNSTWAEQFKIKSSDIQSSDAFGTSVSISEDSSYVIGGAILEDDEGAAYVFNNGYYIY